MVLVLGIGIGIFILAFIWVITLFFCLALARGRGKAQFGAIGVFVLSSLVTIILWVIPREPQAGTQEDEVIYDYFFILRIFLLTFLSFSLVVGGIVLLINWLIEPIMAKPLKKIKL